MIQWITGRYDRRILSLEMIAQEACGNKATYHTLLRAWQRWGYHYHPPDSRPFLSAAQKLARYTFAVKHWDRPAGYWRKGIYTDETVARTNLRRRVKVLRKRGERRRLDCIQFTFNSGRDSIMCWAAIGYNFKSELYFVSTEGQGKGFTQKKYEQQILRGPLAGIFRDRHSQGFFLQDFNKFIDSIPERICKVLARRGAQTPY
ncbi:HMG box protein [Rutstroemia sp. NJR-2017a BBW]|nr:HMG box protein [Rutstroemia sp. NJR-2017a BBW]